MIAVLNGNPLNSLAHEALEALGAGNIDPNYLYSLQLALWLLEEPPELVTGWAEVFRADLLVRGQQMLGVKPELAQRYLVTPGEEETPAEAASRLARSLAGRSAIEQAAALVENLWENLRHVYPAEFDITQTGD